MAVVKMRREERVWKVSVDGRVEYVSPIFLNAYKYAMDIRRAER